MSHPRLPGLEGLALVPVHGETLERKVLRAAVLALPGFVRAEELAPALAVSVRAVAAELCHLRRAGLVSSRDAAPGYQRGVLWQATDPGVQVIAGPPVRPVELTVLEALAGGPLATSTLAEQTHVSLGAVRRAAAALRERGLCKHRARIPSPLGGSERVHEITEDGIAVRAVRVPVSELTVGALL